MSVAVNTAEPAVVEVTVKVKTPLEDDAPEAAEIESVAPRLEERVTVFPETGFRLVSFSVTVIREVVLPLAVTDVGRATTVDWAAVGTPAVNVTVAVWVMVMASVESVAVKTGAPATVDFTVKVATPEEFEVPETVVIVSVAPRIEERVTVLP